MQSLTQPPRDGAQAALDLTLTFDGHRLRMAGTLERPEWVAKDVCRLLHIHNSGQALSNVVPDDERGLTICDTPGGPQQMATVTEPGLYRLILRSRKPAAERFRTWMVRDVIPSIRRHGCFPPPPERPALPALDLDDPGSLRGLVEGLALRRLADLERIAELEPKAEVYDACMSSADLLTVAQVANILARPGRPLGEVRLFRFLRAQRILQADNRPYQDQIDAGRLVARETVWTKGDGVQRIHVQPLITQLGVDYIRRRLDAVSGQLSLLPGRQEARRPS